MTKPLFQFAVDFEHEKYLRIDLHIDFRNNGTAANASDGKGSMQWFMNNSTFHANYK